MSFRSSFSMASLIAGKVDPQHTIKVLKSSLPMKIRTTLCRAISPDITSIELTEQELLPPAADEVQIRSYACAVNFPDLLMIQGKYQYKPELPFAPGTERAGEVLAVGSGVSDFKPGDRVMAGVRCGGFAEAINVPQQAVSLIPGDVSYAKAASYRAAYITAYVALAIRGSLQPGETLLVHGATGGVGSIADQMQLVPQRRQQEGHVVVVGQNGSAGLRMLSRNDPEIAVNLITVETRDLLDQSVSPQ